MCYIRKTLLSDSLFSKSRLVGLGINSLFTSVSEKLDSLLSDYDILSLSNIQQHSIRKRDLQASTHLETLLTFSALKR